MNVKFSSMGINFVKGFRDHKEINLLLEPGEADMTADVNFSHIKNMVAEKGHLSNNKVCV